MKRPPVELSYSKSKALLCPHNYQALYGHGAEQQESSEAARAGTLLHVGQAQHRLHLIKQHRETDRWQYDWNMDRLLKDTEWSVDIEDIIRRGRDNFRDNFSLDLKAERYQVEQRMAVRRSDWQPVAQLPGGGWATDDDTWAGTADFMRFYRGDSFCAVDDEKYGASRHAGDPAEDIRHDHQLRGYCWLAMRHNPQIEYADGTLWFVLYGGKNKLTCTYSREELEDEVPPWIESQFAKVDNNWNERGDRPWKATAHHEVCRWCPLGYKCPLADGLISLAGEV